MELVGKLFGKDRVVEALGQGGMGSVWRTEHTDLEVSRALKLLPEGFASQPALVERFQREAQLMAKLRHPHIVQVHDFGCQDGLYYLVMEHVPGGTLRQRLQKANGPLDWKDAVSILDQICDGLEFAHGKGVVHRDLKPENILLDEQGRVKIADFGLGKLLENVVKTRSGSLVVTQPNASAVTARPDATIGAVPTKLTPGELSFAGQVVGTLEYMSPEQRRGEPVDARTDFFALGIMVFEMLAGRLPAGMETLKDASPGAPDWADELVRRLLAPANRRIIPCLVCYCTI